LADTFPQVLGLGKMRVEQRVETEAGGPSGSPDDAANSGVASGEITDSDLRASIEKHLEETALRHAMLKTALVAGWVG
jgi:hypothetical protein